MGDLVIRNTIKIDTTLPTGTGEDQLTINSTTKKVGQTSNSNGLSANLPTNAIYIGNNAGVATPVIITGAFTLNPSGVSIINDNVIINQNISPSAAISYSKLNLLGSISNADIASGAGIAKNKLEVGNVNRLIINNGSGLVSEHAAIVANRVLVSNANGLPVESAISDTILSYLSGLTGNVQTQLGNRLSFSSALTPSEGDLVYFNGTAWVNLPKGTSGQYLISNASTITWTTVPNGMPTGGTTNQFLKKNTNTDFDTVWDTLQVSDITDITASTAQINVLATGFYDATSSVQTQLTGKQNVALSLGSIWVGNSSGVAAPLTVGTNGHVLTVVGGVPAWQAVAGTGTVTSISGSGGTTGLTLTGGPITSAGTLTIGGTLIAVNGGTGFSSYAIGDILYASSTTALSKLAVGTNGHVLTLSGGVPTWAAPSGGGGSGTVTSVSVVTANGFSGSVATATTTPAITLTLQNATTSQSGQLTSTDWNTFNGKQDAISLTTTGSSGAATFITNTLNIPNYTLSGLGGVATTRTISTTSPLTGGGDLSANITLAINQATTSTNGYLSSIDWNTFNNKQSRIFIYGDDLGLVGDGVTDNYVTLQNIVNTYVGYIIQIGRSSSDVYLISRQISLPSFTHINIDGQIKLKNTVAQPILTTVTNGSTAVDVTNAGTYFVVGERVVLSSDTQPINGGGAWKTRKVGKTNVIQSIVGNTITFTTAFANILGTGSFTAADNGKIASAEGMFKIDGVTNVTITGSGILEGNVDNRYNVAGAVAGVTGDEDLQSNVGILINNSTDILIQGIGGKLTIRNFAMHGIATSLTTLVKTEKLTIDNVKFDASVDKAIAGVQLWNSRITNCENINGRDEGEIILYNGCKNVLIQNILSKGNRRYGVALTGQDNSNIIINNCYSITDRAKPNVYNFYIQNQLYGTSISNITATTEYMESTWSRTTTTATVTTPVAHNLTNGQTIYIGVTSSPTAFAVGYYTITTTGSTTFTFTCNNAGFTTGTLSYLGQTSDGVLVINSSRNVDIKNVNIFNFKIASSGISVAATTAFATTSTDIKIDGVNAKDFYTGSIATAFFSFGNADRVYIDNWVVDGASRLLTEGTGNNVIRFSNGSVQNVTSLYITDNGKSSFENVTGVNAKWENQSQATIPSGQTKIVVNHNLTFAPKLENFEITPVFLGNATQYVIGNISNQSFTIFLDRDPGSGGAVLKWTIKTFMGDRTSEPTYTNSYTSNFTAGVDSWAGTNTVVSGNNDSISDGTTSLDDVLKVYADATNSTHDFTRATSVTIGQNQRIRFKYYIPTGQTNVDGFILYGNGFTTILDVRSTSAILGKWTEVCTNFYTPSTNSLLFRLFKVFTNTFVGANSPSNDIIYIKDIVSEYSSGTAIVSNGFSGLQPIFPNLLISPMTTTGDLISLNSGSPTRIAAGTSGFVLTSNGAGTLPTWQAAPGAGGGITRIVINQSTSTTAGAAASTDYVYICTGTFTLTLPTAVGNTNVYTIKNIGTGTITVDTTSSQTIDGDLTWTIPTNVGNILNGKVLIVVSNGTNWVIIG